MSADIILVPHTHWDREWYEPFQVFRLRLVEVFDDVLARAEAEPKFRFTMDGQLAAVEDYLEIRPEHRDRLAALVAGGQLAIGPWLILLDEVLCSGETIVRNLELGWHGAAGLGGAMPVGYLPDMFGHCAQMPQILARAGIDHACLWRGVPGTVTGHAFRWAAPDGSTVRVEYLWDGYGNAGNLFVAAGEPDRGAGELDRSPGGPAGEPDRSPGGGVGEAGRSPGGGVGEAGRGLGGVDRGLGGVVGEPGRGLGGAVGEPDRSQGGFAGRLVEAARAYRAETASRYGTDLVLGMLGGDHSRPRADLLPLARAAGLPLATLAEYVRQYPPDDPALPVVEGELRSHARGNILPGVISVRVGLKQAMAAAERMVGEAEALAGQWSTTDYRRYLELAWRRIVACTAHDSVTGCGVDETADQVESRLGEAVQLGRAVRDRVLDTLAAAVPSDAYLLVNPSPWPRSLLAELDVAASDETAPVTAELADGTPLPVQELDRAEPLLADETMDAEDLPRLLRRIHGRELFGEQIERYTVRPDRREVSFALAAVPTTPSFDLVALGDELAKAAREAPGSWRVRTWAEPRRWVLLAAPVPASGQTAVRVGNGGAAPPVTPPVIVSDRVLDNGQVRVEVAADGTLTVHAGGAPLTGVGRLVDGGDRGDSYNYGPPARDTVVETPATVRVTVTEAGPLRGAVTVVREYDWPLGLAGDLGGYLDVRAAGTVRVPVTTVVTLVAGEPMVRLAVSFVNIAADHRLRLHVPLPEPATRSYGEGQFAVTARGLSNEGGWGEYPLPTFPAYGFVAAGGVTVLLDHATEYELVGGGTELALTLLRAVGWMSRNVHPLRDEPAGPERAVPGAQYLGRRVHTRLAVLPGGWSAVDAPRWSAELRHPALTRRGAAPAGGSLPAPAAGVAVSGEGVAVPSVRPVDGGVAVRLVAMTGTPTTAVVTGPFTAARRADLLSRPGEELPVSAGRLALPLTPWEIATVHLS